MPTDWEAQYQRGDTPWDKGGPHPTLVDFLAAEKVAGRVLVPGCGTGHDVRALAAHGAEVTGLDLAQGAIAKAQTFSRAGRECYVQGDLFALPREMHGVFDWVFEHTCFCAIDPGWREAYVRAVHAALRPGGRLLAVFYLDPGNDVPDEGPPFESTLGEIDRLFSPLFTLQREWRPARTYPHREDREWMRLLLRA
jgi:SAM-dependent methyltransferase